MFKSCVDGKISSFFIHYKHNQMKNITVVIASQVKAAHLYKNVEG